MEMEFDGDAVVVSVSIAESEDGSRIVSVDTRLSHAPEIGEGVYELSFEISVTSLDGSDLTFSTQDRSIAFGFIPSDVRPLVMPCVCESVRWLIKLLGPVCIYRVTKVPALPDKALYKHGLLTHILETEGYALEDEGTDPLGRTFWYHTR